MSRTGKLEIRWITQQGSETADGLFALFAAMARGEVVGLPGLRPHQREPWHAFAVQVAAMALLRGDRERMPEDDEGWRSLLLGLTPDQPDGEAWALVVEDWSRPALLQPPVVRATDRADYRSAIVTPDALDMLVTSRNHDVKAERMARADAEDWFFALLTLQTYQGVYGRDAYGISRMNGGFASRMVFGLRPAGGMSAAWRRDVERLVEDGRERSGRDAGLSLLWLRPWDGTDQLGFGSLDPLYVDICRRVRLERTGAGALRAMAAGSKVARVAAAALKGNTGDPWTPLRTKDSASVTPGAGGFGYRQFTRLLQNAETVQPPLARPHASDPAEGMVLVAAALVRGQGKTEGLHRREVRVSRALRDRMQRETFLDRVGEVSRKRADDAGEVGRRLRRALLALMAGGPDWMRPDDAGAEAKARLWMAGFDRAVDGDFFDAAFWDEVAGEATSPRRAWREKLRGLASAVFDTAAEGAPRTAERRIRARATARNMLDGSLHRFVEDTADGA